MNKKVKILILVLVIIAIVLFLVRFFLLKPVSEETSFYPDSTLTPAPITEEPLSIFEEQEQIRTANYPLIDKTPYQTTLFEITYSGPLELKVIMFGENQKQIANEVNIWLKENGIDPNSHTIEFAKPPVSSLDES
ncbi:MAG: hypothetical protein PHX72_00110 [Candidatus Shapirobacteria bacterium]|nr:hypothetical protein [Candidatus Shapirobacteria bacterium]